MKTIQNRPCLFIYGLQGDYAELSNFFPSQFIADGQSWNSVEHYYQAGKFLSVSDRECIRNCVSASDARALAWGRLHPKVRPDWDDVRVDVMARALRYKFETCELARRKLLMTWPYPLAEDSVDDTFWGIGHDGTGRNTLGTLLSALRSTLLNLPPLTIQFDLASCAGRSEMSRIATIESNHYAIPDLSIPLDIREFASASLARMTINDLMIRQLQRESTMSAWVDKNVEPGSREPVCFAMDSLPTYDAQSDIPSLVDLPNETLLALRSAAFDEKYGSYRWTEDARSTVPNWHLTFLAWLDAQLEISSAQASGLVIGAGAGEEAAKVWSHFPGKLVLVDIGQVLTQNCRNQHPYAEVRCCIAEDLAGIANSSFDFYCALRTYQSIGFNTLAAITEARRVLRNNGLLVVSVSDAYRTDNGGMQRGQVVGDRIDLAASLRLICELADQLTAANFGSLSFHSLETELVISARLIK